MFFCKFDVAVGFYTLIGLYTPNFITIGAQIKILAKRFFSEGGFNFLQFDVAAVFYTPLGLYIQNIIKIRA